MRLLLAASVVVRLALAAALMFVCLWLASLAVDPLAVWLSIAAGVYSLVIAYQVERETRKTRATA